MTSLSYMRIFLICVIFVNGSYQLKENKEKFKCPQKNGRFADPTSCRKFYVCINGNPDLNMCPSGLYFDDISKFCTFKAEARCGPIATSSPG